MTETTNIHKILLDISCAEFITERQNRIYIIIKIYHRYVEKIFNGLKYWDIINQAFLTLFCHGPLRESDETSEKLI
jgi:hypothetical protein